MISKAKLTFPCYTESWKEFQVLQAIENRSRNFNVTGNQNLTNINNSKFCSFEQYRTKAQNP